MAAGEARDLPQSLWADDWHVRWPPGAARGLTLKAGLRLPGGAMYPSGATLCGLW